MGLGSALKTNKYAAEPAQPLQWPGQAWAGQAVPVLPVDAAVPGARALSAQSPHRKVRSMGISLDDRAYEYYAP